MAVTEAQNPESPRFAEDAKYNTELYLWHQRCGHLASRTTGGLVEDLSKLDQSIDSIAALCIGCVIGTFDRRLFRPTAKKACEPWKWRQSENISTFWY